MHFERLDWLLGVIEKVRRRQTSIAEKRDRKELLKADAQAINKNPW